MLENPACSSSTKYINVPKMVTKASTALRKTMMRLRLARRAFCNCFASAMNPTSFSTRKTRSTRKIRMIRRLLEPGTIRPMNVGRMASKSTSPKKLRA